MRIEEIEIHGFKSFAQKTIIRLDDGISGIVGPNGSGKSNVVDAIKWCLGEQSAKSLRGNAMSDLIFNGTQKRKSQSFAEVAITLALDENEKFPADYERFESLRIARRITREGSSNYSINMAKVRLKDIQNILMDTGLANQNYSFIEQGQIGEIVKARPQETRELIEEAAGISRFKHKKNLSLEQLSQMENNIYSLNLLIESQGREQKKLERQAKKTILYQRYFLDWKKYSIASALGTYIRNIADRKALSQQLKEETFIEEDTNNRYERQRSLYHQYQEKLGKDKETLDQSREESREIRKKLEISQKNLNELQLDLVKNETIQGNTDSRLAEFNVEYEDNQKKLEVEQKEFNVSLQLFRSLETEYKTQLEEVNKEERTCKNLSTELSNINKEFHSNNDKILVVKTTIEGINSQIPKLQANLNRLNENQVAASQKQELIDDKEAEEKSIADLNENLKQLQLDIKNQREQKEGLERQIKTLENNQFAMKKEYQRVLSSCERSRAKYNSLKNLIQSNDGLDKGIQTLLAQDCVLGVIAGELNLSVQQEEFAKSILGENVDALILDATKLTSDFLEKLETRKQRTRFVVIDPNSRKPKEDTTNDFITTYLPCTDLGHRALSKIFENQTLVSNHTPESQSSNESEQLIDLLKMSRSFISQNTGLSFDGKILVSGAITTSGSTILSQKRDLKEVQELLHKQETDVENKQSALRRTEIEIESIRSQITALSNAVSEKNADSKDFELRIKNHRNRIKDIDKNITRLSNQQKFYEQQRTQLESDLQNLFERKDTQNEEMNERTTRRNDLDNRRHEKRSEYLQRQDLLTQQRNIANQIRDRKIAAQNQYQTVKKNTESIESRLQNIEEQQRRLQRELKEKAELIRTSQIKKTKLEQDITTHSTSLTELEQSLEERQLKYDNEIQDLQAINEMLQELNTQRSEYKQNRLMTEQKLTQVKAENLQLRNHIEEQFSFDLVKNWSMLERNRTLRLKLTPQYTQISNLSIQEIHDMLKLNFETDSDFQITEQQVSDDDILEGWIEQREHFKEKVSQLHDINHLAPKEYIEIAQTYGTLVKNKEDLEQSADQIRASIQQLDQVFQQKFKETFDEVNENFRIFYPRLVGGGLADLRLTDPHQLLETGVGIFAQPPGKKLQLLSLLSGGEKALVAIALLFSLFKVRPSPFCLLDEVDAPLDEGNGSRFNSILLEMAQYAQFIVVTHNKKTMEVARILYGISMPEPGVSNLVSVQIDDVSEA